MFYYDALTYPWGAHAFVSPTTPGRAGCTTHMRAQCVFRQLHSQGHCPTLRPNTSFVHTQITADTSNYTYIPLKRQWILILLVILILLKTNYNWVPGESYTDLKLWLSGSLGQQITTKNSDPKSTSLKPAGCLSLQYSPKVFALSMRVLQGLTEKTKLVLTKC